jgi:hypothetical protein
MQTNATLTSGPNDGLHEVVLGAARASREASEGAVGIVELRARPNGHADRNVAIEAEFAHQGERRVIASLEVRVRMRKTASGVDRAALLRDVLVRFGGTALTNACVSLPSGESIDVTVSFGSKVPFWAENLLLPVSPGGERDARIATEILRSLGVHFDERDGNLIARRHQIRSRMTVDQQIAAYHAARSAGLEAALYTASLPCTHSVRFAESGRDGPEGSLDIALSRGLTRSYVCTASDAEQMQTLIEGRLGISFRNTKFDITNTFGDSRAAEAAPSRGLRYFAGKKRRPRL